MKDSKAEALLSQIFKPKADKVHDNTKSVTIMKYLGNDNDCHFLVLDKFNIADEVERLEYMNYLKEKMLKSGKITTIGFLIAGQAQISIIT